MPYGPKPKLAEDRHRPSICIRSLIVVVSVIFICAFLPSMASAEKDDSEHDYHNDEWTFLIISFIMTYATMAIIVGVFSLRYGPKKAKLVAGPMLATGLIIWGIWIFFQFIQRAEYPDDTIFGMVHWVAAPILKPLMAILGVILGAGLVLFIFLTAVVRS